MVYYNILQYFRETYLGGVKDLQEWYVLNSGTDIDCVDDTTENFKEEDTTESDLSYLIGYHVRGEVSGATARVLDVNHYYVKFYQNGGRSATKNRNLGKSLMSLVKTYLERTLTKYEHQRSSGHKVARV